MITRFLLPGGQESMDGRGCENELFNVGEGITVGDDEYEIRYIDHLFSEEFGGFIYHERVIYLKNASGT